jgi:peptide/nickel transport system ATP-binding protein
MNDLLHVSDLVIEREDGTRLVDRVGFDLPRGGSLGIVGESGSGKTLTCRAVLGILPGGTAVSGGEITFDGTDLVHLSERSRRAFWGRRIGAVFQDPASFLNPSIPVGSQLAEALRVVGGRSKVKARPQVLERLADVGLRDVRRIAASYVHELSGGQLQRVLLAIALANDPELLVADEATTALDVSVQAEILDLIAAQRAERGLSLLLVSHDLAVIAQMCDHLVVFQDGRVVEAGRTREILDDPQHPFTRHLVRHQELGGIERLEAVS